MKHVKKELKRPPKKHQPKGMTILYEDKDIIVVDKTNGLLVVSNETVKDNTAYFILNDYVRKGNFKSRSRVFIVHRLDRETSGVLVFAKTEPAKRYLQNEWEGFKKSYYAVVEGKMPEKEGVITSYLAENGIHKMYSTTNSKKGKLSKTSYTVIKESEKRSLLKIDLLTGRKHQIRVHLSDIGCPIVGDKKYGPKAKNAPRLALHAASMSILHPYSKNELVCSTPIPAQFESILKAAR